MSDVLLELGDIDTGIPYADIERVTMSDEGYSVNGVPTHEDNLGLMYWIENNHPILEEIPATQFKLEQEELRVQQLASAGTHRRGIIAMVQEEIIAFGLASQMLTLFNNGDEYIEAWKFSGDTKTLNEQLTNSQSVRLGAALGKVILTEGVSIQEYFITRIQYLSRTHQNEL